MSIRHPSAEEARVLSLRPDPPRATDDARKHALAHYMRRWEALTTVLRCCDCFMPIDADGDCGTSGCRSYDMPKVYALLYALWCEIYRLDPQAARLLAGREAG